MSDSASTTPLEHDLMEVSVPPKYILYLVIDDEELKKNRHYHFTICSVDNENAGFDLLTAEDYVGVPGAPAHLLNLGVRAMMVREDTRQPVHFWLAPRSSIYKTGHSMANSLGVIDASYRGTLKAPVYCWQGADAAGFKRGDRHFQILAPDMGHIQEIQRVGGLPDTTRGAGGFGSTGA
jgi:dUTPase